MRRILKALIGSFLFWVVLAVAAVLAFVIVTEGTEFLQVQKYYHLF